MYTDIYNAIKSAVSIAEPNATFYFGRVSDANLFLEQKPFPQIHLYTYKAKPQTMGVELSDNILMAFILQDTPHSDNEQRLDLTDQADAIQKKFWTALYNTNAIITNYEVEPFYKQFNGVCSGVFVRFTLAVKANSPC